MLSIDCNCMFGRGEEALVLAVGTWDEKEIACYSEDDRLVIAANLQSPLPRVIHQHLVSIILLRVFVESVHQKKTTTKDQQFGI